MATSYVTLAEFKNWVTPTLSATTLDEDATMNTAITAASQLIDDYTGRRFYSTSADETLYFTASQSDVLLPYDLGVDILSITTLSTDEDGDRTYETTWTTSDYDLEPYNAASQLRPYTYIRVTPNGSYSFPTIRRSIKLVGKFGFCTLANLPTWAPKVRDACIMQAARLYMRRVTPSGVGGDSMFGQVRIPARLDADVELELTPLRRELLY